MASKAKPSQTKTDPIIEALQRELKQQGFYAGEIDGQAGEKTTEAVARRDAAAQRAEELKIELLKAQGGKTTADAEAAATAAATARKQRYDDQASSGLGMAARTGANVLAPALGTALGMKLGSGVNAMMDRAQESRNTVLRGAAEDRMAGRTTVEGAREGVRRAGAMPPASAAGRVVSRMLPQVGLGALSLGKGAQVLRGSDPNGEFYPQIADRAAGLGYIGAGAGLMEKGVRYSSAPGVAPDAQALGVINSNQIRRNGPPGAPTPLARAPSPQTIDLVAEEVRPALPAPDQPAAPAPGTKKHLQQQAKDLGVKGTSRLSKSELAAKLTEALSEHGGKRTVAKRLPKLPGGSGAAGLAGGLAYALTPDAAGAADGSPGGGNQAQALTNAGIAGGTAYGVSKLAEKLKPVVGGALGSAGAMMTPMAAADASDAFNLTPDQLDADAHKAAQVMPAWARSLYSGLGFPQVEDAYQMAQVPERGDRSDAAMLARAQGEQAEAMPMASAAALEIPQGIPAPNPDGSSPYPAPVMGRLSRMQQFGATPEQIAHFLNQAVR